MRKYFILSCDCQLCLQLFEFLRHRQNTFTFPINSPTHYPVCCYEGPQGRYSRFDPHKRPHVMECVRLNKAEKVKMTC